MNIIRFLLLTLFLGKAIAGLSARIDTLEMPSSAMHKTYRAAVAIPDSYQKNKSVYPVLYLLHGAFGHFNDWLTHTPDKMLVKNLSDQYNIIIVMPEGETFGWYLNSPSNKQSQFETYLTQEVVKKIDETYRTIHDKKGRVITGLSMGGHGALFLSTRHPDMFCAAGSMSGGLDLDMSNWKLEKDQLKFFRDNFQQLLGSDTTTYSKYSVVDMVDKMKANGLKLIIDCGTDDFLVETNRELHRRLLYNHTPHDYTERPGSHTWDYWQNSLPYHLLFFYNVLKANGVTVQ